MAYWSERVCRLGQPDSKTGALVSFHSTNEDSPPAAAAVVSSRANAFRAMRRILEWIAISLGSIAGMVAVGVVALFLVGRTRMTTPADFAVRPPLIPSDRASIARGRHLAETVTLCTECHQNGLRGRDMGLPPIVATLVAPNLTSGTGGVGGDYTAADWDRAIRHGVGRDGRKLVVMPSEYYAHMTDRDFADLVAFLNSLTPVDNELPPNKLGLLGGALVGARLYPLAADAIKHEDVGLDVFDAGVSAEYGSYLATIGTCRGCHGAELRGKPDEIGRPAAPSLVDSTHNWSAEDFRRTMRTGRTPQGRALDPQRMPWPRLANLTDDELNAVYEYVRSIVSP
jgi:cytochrome c553